MLQRSKKTYSSCRSVLITSKARSELASSWACMSRLSDFATEQEKVDPQLLRPLEEERANEKDEENLNSHHLWPGQNRSATLISTFLVFWKDTSTKTGFQQMKAQRLHLQL
jgi:hypothetical protein